jgi:hypothetical protein
MQCRADSPPGRRVAACAPAAAIQSTARTRRIDSIRRETGLRVLQKNGGRGGFPGFEGQKTQVQH